MFVIYGRKLANIKTATNHEEACKNCNNFDLGINVYKGYFHIFFLPIFPIGVKEVKIRCNSCGESKWIPPLQKHYEKISRTPFYLYAGLIIVAGLILFLVAANANTQRKKAEFVANPHVGDVYTIRHLEKDTTTYFFIKVNQIQGDTITGYHNNLIYYNMVSRFVKEDFFVKEDEISFTKKDLKKMLEQEEVNSVDRDYGSDEGFDREK